MRRRHIGCAGDLLVVIYAKRQICVQGTTKPRGETKQLKLHKMKVSHAKQLIIVRVTQQRKYTH